jgi:hypothetical protein
MRACGSPPLLLLVASALLISSAARSHADSHRRLLDGHNAGGGAQGGEPSAGDFPYMPSCVSLDQAMVSPYTLQLNKADFFDTQAVWCWTVQLAAPSTNLTGLAAECYGLLQQSVGQIYIDLSKCTLMECNQLPQVAGKCPRT